MLQLLTHTGHITRPYQQHLVTENGFNRETLINFQQKFAGIGRECFRFSSVQVSVLLQILELHQQFSLNGYRTNSIEFISVTLHRLSSHCRLVDLFVIYDLRPQFVSQIVTGFLVLYLEDMGISLGLLSTVGQLMATCSQCMLIKSYEKEVPWLNV